MATYGRNLCGAIKGLGYQVGLLYGGRSTRSKSEFLSEVAFFDGAKRKRQGWASVPKMLAGAVSAPGGCRVDRIPVSGSVLYDAKRAKLPRFDTLWNSTDLYKRSQRAFRWFGSFASVDLPDALIAHWTYPLPIRAKRVANIYTLHDLVPLRLPQTTLDNKRLYYSLCKRIVDSADHIVTVSETSKRDIIEILGADPGKVTNTYQAVELPEVVARKSDVDVKDELEGIFNLQYKGYFLFFGAIEPKKNIGRILEAYLASRLTTPLVIVGAPGWKSEEELALLNTLKQLPAAICQRVIRLEYLPLEMLMTVIRGAKATVFPSLYEGFGLPVLESMMLRTPVITSDVGSLREVAGDACLLVDPYNSRSIVAALKAIDTNENLRVEQAEKGAKQAMLFSPQIYAERLERVYEQCLSTASRRAR
ncbi:glycosyltransferase family 4 protein [Paraburkholderia oxyphila]|uniref:glycosyltransferase family 4 protein n=1 Tax=Paraburkholderia oxyphila TaxID=614212 RepID=UPI000A8B6A11|nr:glycosyltransferase family 1 protein [Paraburkholderia oxyphila]